MLTGNKAGGGNQDVLRYVEYQILGRKPMVWNHSPFLMLKNKII